MSDPRSAAHGQQAHGVRLEWGASGGAAIAAGADLAVVVDVLSFTTTLSIAVEREMVVYPYRWKDSRAADYAAARDAALAIGRFEQREAAAAAVSLSPAMMSRAVGIERIVLPSPNGSAISFALAEMGTLAAGACLRNRSAVARWLAPLVTAGSVVAVVPAGERWPDGSLRPAIEDLWGAGAVIAALVDLGVSGLSPEAQHAADAFRAVQPDLTAQVQACASGQELTAVGFADDVQLASEVDVSDVVPVLRGDAFSRA